MWIWIYPFFLVRLYVSWIRTKYEHSFTFAISFFVRESVEPVISHFFLVIYHLVATVGIKVYFTIFAL
jgi:hypothetical protein